MFSAHNVAIYRFASVAVEKKFTRSSDGHFSVDPKQVQKLEQDINAMRPTVAQAQKQGVNFT